MKAKKQMFIGLVLLLVGTAAQAGIYTQSGVGASQVDLFAGTSHDLNFTLGLGEIITDVNVSVNMATGVWGDLDMFITSNGTTVELLSQSTLNDCCQAGNFDVTFDDEASQTIAGEFGNISGSYLPEFGSLSDFDGTALSSLWTLDIVEIFCCEFESTLTAWSVTVTTSDVPEPSIIALFAAGLLGLGFARRKIRS